MKLNFITNNYLIVWNLLYGPSISLKAHAFKQKLWLTYKKEYKIIEKDSKEVLKDFKNFIPDNNTLYDLIEGTQLYERLEKDAYKHRLELMKIWDKNKKIILTNLKEITRIDYTGKYNVIVLPSYMDSCITDENINTIAWGKKKDLIDEIDTLTNIIYQLILKETPTYTDELDIKISKAVLELALTNELYTRITNKSNTLIGTKELAEIKKEIYPYFLMYLGIDLDDTIDYMMRDKQAFDIEKYTNEVQLRKLNLYEFIDFIVRNKKNIIKIKKVGLEIL